MTVMEWLGAFPVLNIKEIYDPEIDATYVAEYVSNTRTEMLGWYWGYPNAASTKEVYERAKDNDRY